MTLTILSSSAERRITALKRELVLELFLRRGRFWDPVRSLRINWNVSAEAQLPPVDKTRVYLPPWNGPSTSLEPRETEANLAAIDRWREDLGALHDRFVPKGCRTSVRDLDSRRDWEKYLSACVLYDPPETQLLEFADSIAIAPRLLCPHCKGAGKVRRGSSFDEDISDFPLMVAPPIENLRDQEELEKATNAHWWRVIDELGARHLEPLGLDVKAMVHSILQDQRIQAEKRKQADQNLPKPYIVVDEFTTDADVRGARSMIAAVQGWDSKGGASRRDRLTAVECAILFDRHGWTLKQLAKHYGWISRDTARKHIQLGLQILTTEKN